jgi:hypothetical protein
LIGEESRIKELSAKLLFEGQERRPVKVGRFELFLGFEHLSEAPDLELALLTFELKRFERELYLQIAWAHQLKKNQRVLDLFPDQMMNQSF